MLLLVALGVLLSLNLVHATSNADGSIIYLCDARSDRWGCNPDDWVGGNRLDCKNKTRIMHWASEPVPSECYELTAPTTSYTPDEYLELKLETTCFKKQFRGILLYAVDSTETKVGDWYVPFEALNGQFSKPWATYPGHICEKSLMHASAVLKPYVNIIKFKAPPAGTGTITFRCLIKEGVANNGAFYWPNNGVDLELTEGPAKGNTEDLQWVLSEESQSCSSTCEAQGLSCDEGALQGLNSASAMKEQVLKQYPCKLPVLSGCGSDGASYDPINEFCYFVDNECAAENRAPSTVSCGTPTTEGFQRFCPCTAAASGSRPLYGLLSLLLVPFFLGNTRLFVLFLLGYASLAYGHNWLQSNARAQGASTFAPCPPPRSPMPHAQVGKDQPFQIEWMNGHDGYNYFAIQHESDADKMIFNTPKLLDDYIAKAPAGINKALDPMLQRFFRKTNTNLIHTTDTRNTSFLELIEPGNPRYFPRPAEFFNPIGGQSDPTKIYQLAYRLEDLQEDVRVSYQSEEYPWLEAVYKFKIVTGDPGRPDFANFYIPGRKGPGRYIVQYYWKGYRDCVDVDLKETLVEEVYGHEPNGSVWNRIDHCLFDEPWLIFSQHSEIIIDAQYCLDRCYSNPNCYGVNVVPLMSPPGVRHFLDDDFAYPGTRNTDIYVQWKHNAFNATREEFIRRAAPDRYMCYIVRPKQITDVTQSEYIVTDDPTDPIFYSTCFLKYVGRSFTDYEVDYVPPDLDIAWKYHHQCISCKQKTENEFIDNMMPKWSVADKCVNCYREPAVLPKPKLPPLIEVAENTLCDGHGGTFSRATHHQSCPNTTVCTQRLEILGRPYQYVNPDECRELVSRNENCSNYWYYYHNPNGITGTCMCYTKEPCCRTCSRKTSTNWKVYEVKSTPDPKCATGVLSDDGAYCCTGTCGIGQCRADTAQTNDAVGFCSTSVIKRSCNEYGPPCIMPGHEPTTSA